MTLEYSAGVKLMELGVASEPSLTADELEIFFVRPTTEGFPEIWTSVRPAKTQPWTSPMLLGTLNDGSVNRSPAISSDGLTLHFTRNRGTEFDVFATTRAARNMPFGNPSRAGGGLSTNADEFDVAFSDDVLTAYVTIRPTPTTYELHTSTRASTAAVWSAATPLTQVNAGTLTCCGYVVGDRLFFTSNRAGTAGQSDLWVVPRSGSSADARLVMGPNTSTLDAHPWVAADLSTLYFTNDSDGTAGIYVATRP